MKARLPKGYGGGPGNVNSMLKQAQEMQANMTALQDELVEREYSAVAGGGMVEVTVTGAHRIKSIKINPDAVDPDDAEMLEDLITVAVNEAMQKADDDSDKEMNAITGGMNIPGLL